MSPTSCRFASCGVGCGVCSVCVCYVHVTGCNHSYDSQAMYVVYGSVSPFSGQDLDEIGWTRPPLAGTFLCLVWWRFPCFLRGTLWAAPPASRRGRRGHLPKGGRTQFTFGVICFSSSSFCWVGDTSIQPKPGVWTLPLAEEDNDRSRRAPEKRANKTQLQGPTVPRPQRSPKRARVVLLFTPFVSCCFHSLPLPFLLFVWCSLLPPFRCIHFTHDRVQLKDMDTRGTTNVEAKSAGKTNQITITGEKVGVEQACLNMWCSAVFSCFVM